MGHQRSGRGSIRAGGAALLLAAGLLLGPSVLPAQEVRVDMGAVLSELRPEIQRAMTEGRIPSATVALVAGDEIVWTGGFGEANRWADVPAVPSTVYLIGSTFKAMSTAALLQQMEQGEFALDDPVNDYLDGFSIRGEEPDQPVTFRHLLTHTSGLPGAFDGFPAWSDTAPPPLEDYLSDELEVVSPPLDSIRYSNLAYTLVGHLVEKFSGIPYREYVRDSVWAPLGMTSTAFIPTPSMQERMATPYVIEEDDPDSRPRPGQHFKAAVWPAGIVYGTVVNQARWLIANLNGGVYDDTRILDEETVRAMHTRQFDEFRWPESGGESWGGDPREYGLTWWVDTRDGDRHFAHSGSVPGYTAFLVGNEDDRLGFAILTNGDGAHPHLYRVADRAVNLMEANVISGGR